MAGSANGGEIRARLTLDNSEFRRNVKDSQNQMSTLDKRARDNEAGFRQLQKTAKVAGLAVAGIGAASIKTAATFEQGMARVKGLTGATGDEFGLLEDAAREAGATTVFSATDASEALSYLSMAGFDATESVDALPGVLNLAAAAQIDLGRSSDIVSNIMTGFGMSTDETERAVDVLVETMTTANTDLPQLGDAMKFVAPVAESLGWSIEETSAAVAKMSDAGIQGSKAGTALRAMLLSLANPTGQAEEAMDELGISVQDTEGNMLPLPDLIGEVSGKFEGMTDTQKTAYAQMLVGREAASGFLAIMKHSPEDLESYIGGLENSNGAAQELADTQNDTLVGSTKEFLSAAEELGISIGNELIPSLRGFVEKGTDVVRMITEINPKVVAMGLKFAAGASSAMLVVGAVRKITTALKAMQLMSGPLGWLSLLAGALGGVAMASMGATEETEEFTEVNLDQAEALAEQSDNLNGMIGKYDELKGASKLSNDEFGRYIDISKELEYETDADRISALKDEQADLAKNAGISNDELDEMVGLNNDILDIAPQTAEAISEGGNAMLDNADAAKDYNDELREQLRLELERQRQNAIKNLKADYEELTSSIERQKELGHDIQQNNRDQIDAAQELEGQEDVLNHLKEQGGEHNAAHIAQQEEKVQEAQTLVNKTEQEGESLRDNLLEEQESTNEKRLGVMEGQKAVNGLMDFYMKQIDVNAEKGKEIEAIDSAIGKLEEQKGKLIANKDANGQLTQEEQEQLNKINEKIGLYGNVKGEIQGLKGNQDDFTAAIEGSSGEMINLNEIGSKPLDKHLTAHGWLEPDAQALNELAAQGIDKTVSVSEVGMAEIISRASKQESKQVRLYQSGLADINASASETVFKNVVMKPVTSMLSNFAGKKHSGGTVHQLPKYHDGGNIKKPHDQEVDTSSLQSIIPPKHDEVDVRLLRNEMVLTQGQQASLFRMIETFGQQQAGATKRQDDEGSEGTSVINVDSLVVREEADVRRIARELDRMKKQGSRNMGGGKR